jgi:hypothetical protein
MTIQGFASDSVQQLPQHVKNVQLVLPAETKHDDAGIVLRWIGSYIGEVQIQGYENPAFGSTDLGQHGITTANEVLIVYRDRLVASYEKLSGQF